MRWLLDTNVVSESVRLKPDQRVVAWGSSLDPSEVAISIVTLAELILGAATARDEERRRRVTRWIEAEIEPSFATRTLPLTVDILTNWLDLGRRLRVRGKQLPGADSLIAATARVHNLIIATRNAKDFAGTGVTVYDPWTGRTHRMAEE